MDSFTRLCADIRRYGNIIDSAYYYIEDTYYSEFIIEYESNLFRIRMINGEYIECEVMRR